MDALLLSLQGGDRRSIGAVPHVVRKVLAQPRLFAVVFDGMSEPDPLVAMRCADAVEKITVHHPELLRPCKKRLIDLARTAQQQELRWHLAQMLPRLPLTAAQRRRVVDILNGYLGDKSRIVKTFAMQALAEIALQDDQLREAIVAQLEMLTRNGSPAMRARGRMLLARLRPCQDAARAG